MWCLKYQKDYAEILSLQLFPYIQVPKTKLKNRSAGQKTLKETWKSKEAGF